MRKCQRSFSGTRSDRMPNETLNPRSKELQQERDRMVESVVVRSVRTPQSARGRYLLPLRGYFFFRTTDLPPLFRFFFGGPASLRSASRRAASASVRSSIFAPFGSEALVVPSVTYGP